jgi:hypothetical protein
MNNKETPMPANFNSNPNSISFPLRALADLSQSAYSALPNGTPDALLAQFEPSLRMLHRLCSSYALQLRLSMAVDPARAPGQRLRMAIGFSGAALGAAPLWSTWLATPLAPYFAPLMDPGAPGPLDGSRPRDLGLFGCEVTRMERYWPLAELGDDAFVRHSELPDWLHAVYPWQANPACRLMAALQLMQNLGEPCAITLALTPSEGEAEYEALHPLYSASLAKLSGGSHKDALGRTEFIKPGPVAEQLRGLRQDLLDALRCEPCFTLQLRCYAPARDAARLLADTVMAEAVSEGPHACWPLPSDLGFFEPALEEQVSLRPPPGVGLPPGLRRLAHVFALSEVAALFRLPVLHEGEQLDLRKETWPPLAQAGARQVLLGHTLTPGQDGGDPVALPLDALVKHTLVVGVPGSGKTNTMMNLARQVWAEHQVPFLALEPAKREYRGLLNLPGCGGQVLLFAPGRAAAREWLIEGELNPLALCINPLEMPAGYAVGEHCAHLAAIFDAAFGLFNPLPAMLESALETVYVERGWVREDIATEDKIARLGFPRMQRLVQLLRELADATDYVGENAATVKAGIEYRFGRLVDGALAGVFGAGASTLRPEEWLARPVIVELESLGEANANLLSLMLQTYLREALTVQQESERQAGIVREPGRKLRHLLFLEEAHNLIGARPERLAADGQADPKAAATAFVIKLLAEVRALGLGIVIGDQLPSALAPEVLKNTSIRICQRLTAPDDRAQMQHSMNASELQLEFMATQTTGQALVSFEGIRKPFTMKMLAADGDQGRHNAPISDQSLLAAIRNAAPGGQTIDERFAANAQMLLIERWRQLKAAPWQGITVPELLATLTNPDQIRADHLLLAELMREHLSATARCGARLQLWLQPLPEAEPTRQALALKLSALDGELHALQQALAALQGELTQARLAAEIGRRFDPGQRAPGAASPYFAKSPRQARWWYERALLRGAHSQDTAALSQAHFGLWTLATRDKSRKAALQTSRQRNLHHLRKAAELGLPEAQVGLSVELAIHAQSEESRFWLQKAVEQNYPPALQMVLKLEEINNRSGEGG